jgi:hypothetical protein
MDWIEDLIRYEKAKERERRRRMQKRKIKNPQEKNWLHKMHRKEINKYLIEKCKQPDIFVNPICTSTWFKKIKKIEQRLQEQLIYNLIHSGFIVHQEIAVPHRVWPIRLDVYAQKEDAILGFEVKRTLDIRSLGQVAWYSRCLSRLIPGIKVFLAFSCHEFSKFISPDVEEYVNKLREDFGVGICGIRDPLGDAPNAAKLYFNSFKWFDICMDCPFNKGFRCFSINTWYTIPRSRIEELDERLRDLFRSEID